MVSKDVTTGALFQLDTRRLITSMAMAKDDISSRVHMILWTMFVGGFKYCNP